MEIYQVQRQYSAKHKRAMWYVMLGFKVVSEHHTQDQAEDEADRLEGRE